MHLGAGWLGSGAQAGVSDQEAKIQQVIGVVTAADLELDAEIYPYP